MHEPTDPRAEAFLDALEAALGGPGPRAAEVLAEVRSDLEAAVARAVDEGAGEPSAWTRALDDLGDPQALAEAMRGELPPERPAAWVAHARRAAAALVATETDRAKAPASTPESDDTPSATPPPTASEEPAPQLQGKLVGAAASKVAFIVLHGPDNVLREAARVVPEPDGSWSIAQAAS